MHHHPPVKLRKSLMDVEGRDVKGGLYGVISQ
jgi:hypothetical protein